MREYYVYILSNPGKTLYIGVTNDLERRMYEHKHGLLPGFALRYRLTKLVYFEAGSDIGHAIAREKQLKGWLRRKKLRLVESMNPSWVDLSESWLEDA
jgi:putative endonuclease